MSRRCRASLFAGSGTLESGLSSGCNCGRLGGEGGSPCTEPLTYGELLPDPGLELLFDNLGGQINLPRYETSDPSDPNRPPGWKFVDDTFISRADGPLYMWTNNSTLTTLNTIEQFEGNYCIEYDIVSESEGFLQAGMVIPCKFDTTFPMFRVQPGDLVIMSCWAKNLHNDNRLGIELNGLILDNTGPGSATPAINAPFTVFPTLTTTYQEFKSAGFVVTPTSHWLLPRWKAELITNGGTVFFDKMSVQILPASATGLLLCAFSSLITIDNSTTETSFL